VGILRDIPQGAEEACVKTAVECGLKAIEVTMNTANAEAIIADLKAAAKPYGIAVGAGTVRHGSDLEKAIGAGAEFIVTPNTRNEIIRLSATARIPIIPGALTPTEVQKAFDLGATAVKIFPVNCVGGPEYIKALRGPFRDIPLMACGGVNAENVQAYLKAGSNLVSFGASIYDPKLMAAGDWATIAERLKKLLASIK
jgi:2-dehydro-3-deoxyphosphogluconate aldolase/(4S)-4-hydroxy-2-oxoglutarate aldolase